MVTGITRRATSASAASRRSKKHDRTDEQQHCRDDLDESAADEVAHEVDVARHPGDQLAGLGTVVIGEAEALQLVEDLVAHVERGAVARPRREVALQEARETACGGDRDERERVAPDDVVAALGRCRRR